MKNKDNFFHLEIYKIIIDRLLIGGLIILLGYLATLAIERYKAKEAFYNEINKVRVSKIAEVWEQANLVDYQMQQFLIDYSEKYEEIESRFKEAFNKDIDQYVDMEGFEKYQDLVDKFKNELNEVFLVLKTNHLSDFKTTLHKNRFWLDDESYKKLKDYVSKTYRFEIITAKGPDEWRVQLEKNKKELEDSRGNIEGIQRKFISGK